MVSDPPSIYIFNVRLDEPTTTITDLLIAGICIYAFFRLKKMSGGQKLHNYLTYYFLLLGVGTFLAGLIGHGFLYLFSPGWKLPGWLASMLAMAAIQQASIILLRSYKGWIFHLLTGQNLLLLLASVTMTIITREFLFVILYITYGILIVVGGIHLIVFLKSKRPSSLWFLMAVTSALAGDFVFLFEWSLHDWFNNIDLSHILLGIAAYFFYIGSRGIIQTEKHPRVLPADQVPSIQ